MLELLKLLERFGALPDGIHEDLFKILKTKTVSRKEKLVKVGEICKIMHFVETGLFRGYVMDRGQERNVWFMKEGDLMTSVTGYYSGESSQEGIEALEDAVVWFVKYEDAEALYKKYPTFNINGRNLTEHYYRRNILDLITLTMSNTHDRLNHFYKLYPEMDKRIPGIQIASFIGVSEATYYKTVKEVRKANERKEKQSSDWKAKADADAKKKKPIGSSPKPADLKKKKPVPQKKNSDQSAGNSNRKASIAKSSKKAGTQKKKSAPPPKRKPGPKNKKKG